MPPRSPTEPEGRRYRRARALCALAAITLLPELACSAQPVADDTFPRSALQIHSSEGLNWFNIRIADTDAHRELGLMFVTRLPSDEGMLFPEDHPQIISMWMKNTLIPLDMLFIDTRGRIVCLLENAKPESLQILSCDKPAKAVLEIGGGEAQRRGIKVGDKVDHATFRTSPHRRAPDQAGLAGKTG
ncbi:MAG TPA: DUF192 domain-containing protein [Steroidobacteraceae bacterium]|nr:DUF192 domain-containing protein [Steroidobacteraceae bacterium]